MATVSLPAVSVCRESLVQDAAADPDGVASGVSSGAQAARVVIRAAATATARGVARLDMVDSLEM